MKLNDVTQHYQVEGRDTVLTYDTYIIHEKYGIVRMRAHRRVGNDSGLKSKMTADLLKRHEPDVGMWPGDVLEYFDVYGQLLERKTYGH